MIDGELDRQRMLQAANVRLQRRAIARQDDTVGAQDQMRAARMSAGDADKFPKLRMYSGFATL